MLKSACFGGYDGGWFPSVALCFACGKLVSVVVVTRARLLVAARSVVVLFSGQGAPRTLVFRMSQKVSKLTALRFIFTPFSIVNLKFFDHFSDLF